MNKKSNLFQLLWLCPAWVSLLLLQADLGICRHLIPSEQMRFRLHLDPRGTQQGREIRPQSLLNEEIRLVLPRIAHSSTVFFSYTKSGNFSSIVISWQVIFTQFHKNFLHLSVQSSDRTHVSALSPFPTGCRTIKADNCFITNDN